MLSSIVTLSGVAGARFQWADTGRHKLKPEMFTKQPYHPSGVPFDTAAKTAGLHFRRLRAFFALLIFRNCFCEGNEHGPEDRLDHRECLP